MGRCWHIGRTMRTRDGASISREGVLQMKSACALTMTINIAWSGRHAIFIVAVREGKFTPGS